MTHLKAKPLNVLLDQAATRGLKRKSLVSNRDLHAKGVDVSQVHLTSESLEKEKEELVLSMAKRLYEAFERIYTKLFRRNYAQ